MRRTEAGRAAHLRADVWSLGAVLYELLAGPQPRKGHTSEAVVARARQG